MGYQTAPNGSFGPPCELYHFMSRTEDTALLFESEWLLQPAFCFPPAPASPPPSSCPPTSYRLNLLN